MIAGGLTKDKIDPADLLRSCVRAAMYQISPENHVLAQQASERARRAKNREQSPVWGKRRLRETDFSKGKQAMSEMRSVC